MLACAEIEKNTILFAKAVDHFLVMNLKDWIELQLNWILNFPFCLIRKQQTPDNTIRTILYWYKVETHSIPDQKEVENLTDLNVDAMQ